MKVQIIIEKNSEGVEVVKARGYFYEIDKETKVFKLNEDGSEKTVKNNKIVASICIPNSIGNRGSYFATAINNGVASNFSYEVQLKSKYFNEQGEWVFKIEKWSKELHLEEYFIGTSDNFKCNCVLELKDKEFYFGYVNKHGYFVVTEKYDKTKLKSKKHDRVQ